MGDIHRNNEEPVTQGVRHEKTDVSLPGLLLFVGILGLTGVMVHVATALVFQAFTRGRVVSRDGRALSSAELGPLPAEPVLEGLAPQSEVETGRRPDSYGWVDRRRNIARIPVEKAKAVLAGRLPARPAQPEPPAATDANGGQPRKGLK